MKSIEFKASNGEVKSAIVISRIGDLFFCKSSSKKRVSDLTIHIDNILSDISDIKEEHEEIKTLANNNNGDEFDGLCQANELGLTFPDPTFLVR